MMLDNSKMCHFVQKQSGTFLFAKYHRLSDVYLALYADIPDELLVMAYHDQCATVVSQCRGKYIHACDVYVVGRLVGNDHVRRIVPGKQAA